MVDKIFIKISGRVQGVGFRYNIIDFSTNHELTGFAKNLSDGRVEIFAEGPKDKLLELIDYIKGNPGLSQVENVDISWDTPAKRTYSEFKIKIY